MGMSDMHKDVDLDKVGDFGKLFGADQLKGKSADYVADIKLKEIENGRLAMVAIGGIIHHTIIGGTEIFGSFPNSALWEGKMV